MVVAQLRIFSNVVFNNNQNYPQKITKEIVVVVEPYKPFPKMAGLWHCLKHSPGGFAELSVRSSAHPGS